MEKWPFLDQNLGLTPLVKCQFIDFLNFLFLQVRTLFFRSRISLKTFSWNILPKNEKVGKMDIYGPKPWLNPFGKMVIFFDFLNFLFLQLRKAFFPSRISSKTISQSILPKKKKLVKWPFLDQNHGLTPLRKGQFFDFLKFLFLYFRKAFFRSGISLKKFFWLILPKKKKLEKRPFLDKNRRLTPLEKCQFFDFKNLLF